MVNVGKSTIHVSHGLCQSEVFGNQLQLKVFGSDPNLFVSFFLRWGGAKDDLTIRIPQKVNLKRFSQIGSIKYQMYQCTMLQGSIQYNLTGIGVKIKNSLKPPPRVGSSPGNTTTATPPD